MSTQIIQTYHKPVKTFPERGGYRAYGYTINGYVHNGEDYRCDIGSHVCSVLDGIIVLSAELSGFGSLNPSTNGGCIIVKHRFIRSELLNILAPTVGVFFAIYGHLNRKFPVGSSVVKGQVLGTIRPFTNEGVACPHLHFGIYTGSTHPTSHLGYSQNLTGFHNPKQFLDSNAQTCGMQCNGNWAPFYSVGLPVAAWL